MNTNEKLVQEWADAQYALDLAKKKEAILRKEVVMAYFKDNQGEGTNNVPLANGYSLKLKQNYIRSFVDDLPYEELIAKMQSLGIEGEKFIKLKASLVLSEYRKLEGDKKLAFDTMLEIKPSMPSIEIVAPKGEK